VAMRSVLMSSLAAILLCTVGCSSGNKPASETAPAAAPPAVSATPPTAAGGILANDTSAAVALQCAQTARDVPGNQGTSWYMKCPATCAEERPIWGTDVFTDDSSVCRAAVHAQAISASQGGLILVTWAPAQATYAGTTRNGVTSQDYGAWGRSFFVQAVDAVGKPTSPAAVPVPAGNARLSCRHTGGVLTGQVGKTWRVSCPAGCTRGSVWGTDVYTSDSPACAAAIHAGVLTAAGGDATLTVDGPQTSFRGSARNGITSQDYGAYASSYRLTK
jgi:hypothetical protein